MSPSDRIIGIIVAQHINWRTGQWKLAEETIAYKAGVLDPKCHSGTQEVTPAGLADMAPHSRC